MLWSSPPLVPCLAVPCLLCKRFILIVLCIVAERTSGYKLGCVLTAHLWIHASLSGLGQDCVCVSLLKGEHLKLFNFLFDHFSSCLCSNPGFILGLLFHNLVSGNLNKDRAGPGGCWMSFPNCTLLQVSMLS